MILYATKQTIKDFDILMYHCIKIYSEVILNGK